MKNTLCVITARGGSKGVPKKNIKCLGGVPLIHYTIEAARAVFPDESILVSTDSEEIRDVTEETGLRVPFLRPPALALDTTGSHEVLIHGLDEMEKRGAAYDTIVLLQPTSPFRTAKHIETAMTLFDEDIDMVASVKQIEDSPYFNMFRESGSGWLELLLPREGVRRQDCPAVYTYNGALYVIRASELRQRALHSFRRVRKFLMGDEESVQIDTPFDWTVAEAIIQMQQRDSGARDRSKE